MASFNSHETYVVRDECAHEMKHNKQQQQRQRRHIQKNNDNTTIRNRGLYSMLVNQTSSGGIIINNNFIYFKQIALFPIRFYFDALLSKQTVEKNTHPLLCERI